MEFDVKEKSLPQEDLYLTHLKSSDFMYTVTLLEGADWALASPEFKISEKRTEGEIEISVLSNLKM